MGVRTLLGVGLPACAALLLARPVRADASACAGVDPPVMAGDYQRWVESSGCVTVRVAEAADLAAPAPDVARVRAERRARDEARLDLARAVGNLNLGDELVGHRMLSNLGAMLRTLSLVDAAVVNVSYHSDGGVVVRIAITSADLVSALLGPDAPASASGSGVPAALVLDATGASPDRCLAPHLVTNAGLELPRAAVRYLDGDRDATAPVGVTVSALASPSQCELVLSAAASASVLGGGAADAPRFVRLVTGKDERP